MKNEITFTCQDDYLYVSISDNVITAERAREILARIGEECADQKCNKVLLDELSVERREVDRKEIEKLAFDFKKNKLDKVYMAFLCRPHLVGFDSNLLSLYTYTAEFIVRHFSDKEEAIEWLNDKKPAG